MAMAAFAAIVSAQEAKAPGPEESKKELLKRMEALEENLPNGLARKLISISMKVATGWCSPYLAREFEAEIQKLPERERRRFDKEWKLVREHDAWPGRIAGKPDPAPPPKK
jgi:hypothetical protein